MIVRLFFPWVGGMERQALKLAKKLIEKGVDVEILTGWWFPGTEQREWIDGVPIFRNLTLWEMFGIRGLRRFGGYLYIFSLYWYLWRTRNDYDVLHVHGLNYHTYTAVLAGHRFGKKVLAKLANSGNASDIQKMRLEQQLPLESYMLPKALECDCFVATTPTIADDLASAGVSSNRIVLLPNGVEADDLRPKSNYALGKSIRVLYVGRLHEQKGVDVLLRGFQQLVRSDPYLNITLQLAGSGPLRESLTMLAKQLGIDSKVEFIGQTDEVYEYMQKADIFVLPSRAEGMSNALLEAMTFGLPVVVSDIPGNAHLIQQDVNGLLFENESAESLAENLSLLLGQDSLRERLGKEARRTIDTQYSLDSVADEYIKLYRKLLSEK